MRNPSAVTDCNDDYIIIADVFKALSKFLSIEMDSLAVSKSVLAAVDAIPQ